LGSDIGNEETLLPSESSSLRAMSAAYTSDTVMVHREDLVEEKSAYTSDTMMVHREDLVEERKSAEGDGNLSGAEEEEEEEEENEEEDEEDDSDLTGTIRPTKKAPANQGTSTRDYEEDENYVATIQPYD